MAHPIWKDYYVSLGNISSSDYSIMCGSEVIFTGTAFRKPNETTLAVRINDICADYLQTQFFSPSASSSQTGGNAVFSIYNGSGSLIHSVEFVNDWSYRDRTIAVMSEPITGEVCEKQKVPYTRYGTGAINATLTFSNGTTSSASIPAPSGATEPITGIFDLSVYNNLVKMAINGIEYRVVTGSHRFALVYSNAFGGWDSILLKGLSIQNDEITRYTHEQEYNNTQLTGRGTRNFVNEVVETITCNTGLMNEAQADRMYHLVESVDVYLYDIENDTFTPVCISDTACEHKKYRKEGQPINYTIELRIARHKTRR